MPATEYLRSALGNHVLLNTGYTSPTDVYLALFTAAPTIAGGGTEVTGGSYARPVITFTETATDGEFENNSVSISDMPAATVVALGIYDAVSGGNLLYFETFSAVSVGATETYPVNAGVLTIRHT
jgi:hypothetical protein